MRRSESPRGSPRPMLNPEMRRREVMKVMQRRGAQRQKFFRATILIMVFLFIIMMLLSTILSLFYKYTLERLKDFDAQILEKPSYREREGELIAHEKRMSILKDKAITLSQQAKDFDQTVTNILSQKRKILKDKETTFDLTIKDHANSYKSLTQELIKFINDTKNNTTDGVQTVREINEKVNSATHKIESLKKTLETTLKSDREDILKNLCKIINPKRKQLIIVPLYNNYPKPSNMANITSNVNGYPIISADDQNSLDTFKNRPTFSDIKSNLLLNNGNDKYLQYKQGSDYKLSIKGDFNEDATQIYADIDHTVFSIYEIINDDCVN